MAVSPSRANAMLGAIPNTLYVQPHSGEPGSDGTQNVISATRGTATFGTSVNGQRAATGNTDITGIAGSVTVTHVSYWDTATDGAFQFSEALPTSVTFTSGGTLRLTSQILTIGATTALTRVISDTAGTREVIAVLLQPQWIGLADAAGTVDASGWEWFGSGEGATEDSAGAADAAGASAGTTGNAFANPGFESALNAAGGTPDALNWTPDASSSMTRETSYFTITPHGGTYMLNVGVGSHHIEQLITGDEYRASAGNFIGWFHSQASIPADSSDDSVYLTIIARDSGQAQLGRVDIWVVGLGGYSGGGTHSSAQTGALAADTWTEKTIDVRTSLDAAIGANLSSVADVRFLVRTFDQDGSLTLRFDDFSF